MGTVGWLFICLLFLWWFVFLFFFFFSTQSFIICPPQSAEFYFAACESPAPLQTGLRLFVNVSVATLDTERRARTVLPNIWSICCFTGPTPPLKMPQGTAPFTFLPCTIRYVCKLPPHHCRNKGAFQQPLFPAMAPTNMFVPP